MKKGRSRSRRRAYSNVSANPEARAASNKAISNTRAKKKPLISVPGKRRVWGTLKVCSASTVRKVILQVAKLPEEATLQVKRKFKTAGEDKRVVRWWHVISGDEEVLSLLDRNWENVEVQTSWQIEPCLIAPQKPEAASSSNVNVNGSPGSSSSTNELNTPTPDELDSRIPQSNSTPAPIPSPTTEVLASEQIHVASSLHILTNPPMVVLVKANPTPLIF